VFIKVEQDFPISATGQIGSTVDRDNGRDANDAPL
jgi:hypothetical protein